jgi:hypothetical protein
VASEASAAKASPTPTTTILSSSSSVAVYGKEQAVVFSVTVSASNGEKPSGKGSVLLGKKKVCALAIKNGSGSCSPKATAFKNGSYSLVATFKKSKKFRESTSNSVDLAVGTPPTTTLTNAPTGKVPSGPIEITFTSDEPLASFQCSLDGAPYTSCMSPDQLNVGPGAHEFEVRAVSATGIVDPTPASASWTSVGQAPTVELCGEITHSEALSPATAAVFVITCPLIIAHGATITIEPSTIIKTTRSGEIDVYGSLVVDGTSGSPVTFTSFYDDTVGGDTDGDGGAEAPRRGDWSGIQVLEGGQVNAQYAVVDYASDGFSGSEAASLVVSHSTVENASNDGFEAFTAGEGTEAPKIVELTSNLVKGVNSEGVSVRAEGSGSAVTVPVIESNTVDEAGSDAFDIEGEALDPSKLTGNGGSSDSVPAFSLGGKVAHNLTLPLGGLPLVIDPSYGLTINAGVTMTVPAGTVIKAKRYAEFDVYGSLVVDGTSGSPVTFTSFYDDTVGGDTDGDGGAEAPRRGDWSGIQVLEGGQVNAQYAVVDYASDGFSGSEAASLVVSHSTVENASNDGFEAFTAGEGTEAPKIVELTSNLVKGVNSEGVSVRAEGSGSAVTVPVIESNTVDEAGSDAFDIEGEALDPSKLTGNGGSSDSVPAFSLGGKVAHNLTLPLGGLPLVIDPSYGLTINAGVTMTVPAGTVIKAKRYAEFDVYGSLVVDGTSGSPVTFTSFYDDTVGGDTDGDGGAEAPKVGDWSGILLGESGTASLEETIVKYASTGLAASGKSFASVRGRFESDSSDVSACGWGGECGVDAAYSYWGNSAGAYPAGKEDLACGSVTATPYRTNPSGSKTATGSSPFDRSCGGEAPDENLATAQSSAAEWESIEGIQCGEGYEEACKLIEKYRKCLGAAATLAQEESPFTFSNGLQSLASDGASWLETSETVAARVIGGVANFGLQFVGVAKTLLNIANAYDSCT